MEIQLSGAAAEAILGFHRTVRVQGCRVAASVPGGVFGHLNLWASSPNQDVWPLEAATWDACSAWLCSRIRDNIDTAREPAAER